MSHKVPPAVFSSPDFPREVWLDTSGMTPEQAEKAALQAATDYRAEHVSWRITADGVEMWILHLPKAQR